MAIVIGTTAALLGLCSCHCASPRIRKVNRVNIHRASFDVLAPEDAKDGFCGSVLSGHVEYRLTRVHTATTTYSVSAWRGRACRRDCEGSGNEAVLWAS
jgi:hypothetical protein